MDGGARSDPRGDRAGAVPHVVRTRNLGGHRGAEEYFWSAVEISVWVCRISHDAVTQRKPPIRDLIGNQEGRMGFGLPHPTKFNRTWDRDGRKNRQLHIHPVLILDGVKGFADEFAEPGEIVFVSKIARAQPTAPDFPDRNRLIW